MKKKIIIILIFFVFMLLSCNNHNGNTGNIQPFTVNIKNNIKVEVNPRIELLTIIQYLADYDLLTDFDLDYKKDIDKYFKDYKDHEAVNQYKVLAKKGFIVDDPIVYFLNCTSLPDLEVSENISYSQNLLITGIEDINEFRESTKNFYEESNFKEFYKQHRELYSDMLKNYNKNSETIKKYIDNLEEYTGKKQKSYNIILSPLIHQGGFGPSLNEEKDKYDAYIVLGATISQEIYKEFDNDYEKAKKFSDTSSAFELSKAFMIHEFTHTHLRSMEKEPYLSTIKKKFDQIDKNTIEDSVQFYNTWDGILNEYFVRAVTARVLYLEDEKEEYEKTINNDKTTGFKYIEKLIEKLREYENNRGKYKQIEDFYPELLDELVKQYN